MRLIMYYQRMKQQLVRKTHHFPITSKNKKQIEGLHYDIAMYINMGYYKL